MTIHTKYNIGDTIEYEGEKHKVASIHLYESKNKHTERYYLGNHNWVTIEKSEKKG